MTSKRGGSRTPGTRPQRGAGAGRPPTRAPERRVPVWRPGPWILAGAIVLAVGVVVAMVVWRSDGTEPAAGGPDPERVAELQEQEEVRNAEHVSDLTELAVEVQGDLLPVLQGLERLVPSDGEDSVTDSDGGGAMDDGAEPAVTDWRQTLDGAAGRFGDPPSASTGVNATRGGLVLAVDLLRSALEAYEASVTAEPAQRQDLLALAGRLRSRAVDAWDLAAIQLDLINIEAGHGHVHLHLETAPDNTAAELGGFRGGPEHGDDPPSGGFGG